MNAFSPATPPLRIFVVENHADTLKWLTIYLEDSGHSVQSARSVGEALATLSSAECDVLLCDIGLPDGDGWSFLRSAQLPRQVYTIAMSGMGMNADRARSFAAGFRQHLLKPFKTSELDRVLEAAAGELSAR